MGTIGALRPETSFSERVSELLERVDYRTAVSDQEKDDIYRLRYEAYLREGSISPSFAKRLSDRYDDLDNSWIFGVFVDESLASSIRITVASSAHAESPAIESFHDVLAAELERDRIIVDPTRFVVDRKFSRLYPDLRYATTRIAWMACEHFGADLLLASVRTEHQAFYKRVFGHAVVCDPRPYPTLIKPLSLMVSDFSRQRDRVNHRFHFFRSSYFERRMLFGHLDVAAASPTRRTAAEPGRGAGKVAALAG
ncbi:MAG: hypothetical protein WD036_06680 [Bauldia sp.]